MQNKSTIGRKEHDKDISYVEGKIVTYVIQESVQLTINVQRYMYTCRSLSKYEAELSLSVVSLTSTLIRGIRPGISYSPRDKSAIIEDKLLLLTQQNFLIWKLKSSKIVKLIVPPGIPIGRLNPSKRHKIYSPEYI